MNILLITHTRIGDAVLSSGILRHLVESYPDARFTIACGPLAVSLFAAVPRLERVIVVTKRPFDGHWFKLWREVRTTAWNLVVDLRRSLVSYFLSARERRILGRANDRVHRVEYLSSVLRLPAPAAPYLFTDAGHQVAARGLIPDGPPVLAVSPVAATGPKTWPVAQFAEVIAAVTAPDAACAGWRVALFGAGADRAAVAPLISALALSPILIFDQTDLLTVHATLGRCAAFLGNDSGLGHLAACAGVPALALFGPTDPLRYAPWGRQCAALRAENGDITRLKAAAVAEALARLIRTNPPSDREAVSTSPRNALD